MPKRRRVVTRRQLLVAAAPALAAAPLAKLALGEAAAASAAEHAGMAMGPMGHAAMIGGRGPAPRAARHDLDALLYPAAGAPAPAGPRPRVHARRARQGDRGRPGRRSSPRGRTTARSPGPVIRATEDDLLRVDFANGGSHPHTIHFHGIHPANMDGVFEIVEPGRVVHVRVPGAPVRDAALPLPRDAAEEAHPQGPLRRLHHRPARSRARPRRSS